MKAASRGTSRWRRPTEQVISPPAPGPGLGESRRALTQGARPMCSPTVPSPGPTRLPSLIFAVACIKAHPVCSGLPLHLSPKAVTPSLCPQAHYSGRLRRPTIGFRELLLPGSAIIAIPLPVHHSPPPPTPTRLCSGLSLDGGIPQCPWFL